MDWHRDKSATCCLTRSKILPGVATIRWIFFKSLTISFFIETPPVVATTAIPVYLASDSTTIDVCDANSRVGTRMRTTKDDKRRQKTLTREILQLGDAFHAKSKRRRNWKKYIKRDSRLNFVSHLRKTGLSALLSLRQRNAERGANLINRQSNLLIYLKFGCTVFFFHCQCQ